MRAYRDGSRVRLISRNGVEHTARFPGLAAAITKLRADPLALDRKRVTAGPAIPAERNTLTESTSSPSLRPPIKVEARNVFLVVVVAAIALVDGSNAAAGMDGVRARRHSTEDHKENPHR
jgi:hypothetical protein